MSHCQTSRFSLIFAAALLSLSFYIFLFIHVEANAGPIERELTEKGGNVGIPKLRPNIGQDAAPVQPVAKEEVAAPKQVTPKPVQDEAISRSESGCLAQLKKLAEAQASQTPEAKDPACLIPDPVQLVSTRSQPKISFTDGLTLDCPFALALARFSSDTVQALAQHHLGASIARIDSGEGFVCRRRNNSPTGKISEHAFGNATDWVGFRLDNGGRLAVTDVSRVAPNEAAFLNSVRSAACGTFTTVLGPGSNAAHDRHFHFDLGRSKDRKNPYRICE
ncbi:MAG: extensin family protein [Rhizobiaceae bacterium]